MKNLFAIIIALIALSGCQQEHTPGEGDWVYIVETPIKHSSEIKHASGEFEHEPIRHDKACILPNSACVIEIKMPNGERYFEVFVDHPVTGNSCPSGTIFSRVSQRTYAHQGSNDFYCSGIKP